MYGLIQRVARAEVRIAGTVVGAIARGLLLFVCAEPEDTRAQADKLLAKTLGLRIFADDAGKMNRSVRDLGGGLLIVSQFTLAADTRHGMRPGFSRAAPPAIAQPLYDYLIECARAQHCPVATGAFGADMQITLINDGPVTIPLRITAHPAA